MPRPAWLTAARLHGATLVVGAGVLLMIGRYQWFFGDDWAILGSDFDFAANHQGHWNLLPAVLFAALKATVGLHSYLPYLALALIAHLAVVHLVWRISVRAGARPWLATAMAGGMILFGAAAENVLWAFQVGFMGALALGLAVLLLVDSPREAVRPLILAALLSVVALPFSGTALPVLAGAAVLSWLRRGWRRTVLVFAPAAIAYLTWYLLAGGGSNVLGPEGTEWVTQAPLFFATMFAAGYGQWTGLVVLGPVVAVLLVVFVVRDRRQWTSRAAIAYCALLASGVFALLTTASRAGGELTAAGAQRYVYVIVMLAVPVAARAVDAVIRESRAWQVAAATVLLTVGAVNAALLIVRAEEQAGGEARIARDVAAAADLVASDPLIADSGSPVVDGAPDLTVGDLRDLLRDGALSPRPYGPDSLDRVRDWLAVPS